MSTPIGYKVQIDLTKKTGEWKALVHDHNSGIRSISFFRQEGTAGANTKLRSHKETLLEGEQAAKLFLEGQFTTKQGSTLIMKINSYKINPKKGDVLEQHFKRFEKITAFVPPSSTHPFDMNFESTETESSIPFEMKFLNPSMPTSRPPASPSPAATSASPQPKAAAAPLRSTSASPTMPTRPPPPAPKAAVAPLQSSSPRLSPTSKVSPFFASIDKKIDERKGMTTKTQSELKGGLKTAQSFLENKIKKQMTFIEKGALASSLDSLKKMPTLTDSEREFINNDVLKKIFPGD